MRFRRRRANFRDLPRERAWVHPSELSRFDGLTATPWSRRSRLARGAVGAMALALMTGLFALGATHHATPAGGSLARVLPVRIAQAPALARRALEGTLEVQVQRARQEYYVSALVVSPHYALIPLAVDGGATLSATDAAGRAVPLSTYFTDPTSELTVVHLTRAHAVAPLGTMPDDESVVALAPARVGSQRGFAVVWTRTLLGDPARDALGDLRTLTTAPEHHLAASPGALAISDDGRVVAVLGTNHRFYDAALLAARVRALTGAGHCSADLAANFRDVQGGGVTLYNLRPHGAAVRAGLRAGDVVLAAAHHDLDGVNDLRLVLALTPGREPVALTIVRNGVVTHRDAVTDCAR